MKVPFFDLKAQYESIQFEINAALQQVIKEVAFSGGPFVERFEKDFAAFCQCKYAVACSSGTSALQLALAGMGIKDGDEVITVPNTFFATAEAITACGAKPVFIDIDEQAYTLNTDLLEEAITPRTRAVIPVHLYGQVCDMETIIRIAYKHNLIVIEDACQAHGAEYKGRVAGSMGDAGCFSFYPSKNLGAYGEAGAVVTNNPKVAQRMKMLRSHGEQSKYYHSIVGWNSRMDGIQGAILSVKLKHLPKWNKARQKYAQLYNQLLSSMDDIVMPAGSDNGKHVYHIYAVRVPNRDILKQKLAEQGIGCGIHYPVPIHLQKAYKFLGYSEGDFPVSEAFAKEVLSLPMFPELRPIQIETVCKAIKTLIPAVI